jgi:tripartite-type tricarboxylate transporter receptor subunit TctC
MMNSLLTKRSLLAAGFAAAVAGRAKAQAEAWPSRPVRVIVPMAPGGSTDVVARLIAQALQAELQQSFVIENRSGGGSVIGTQAVIAAVPDGYTLLVNGMPHTIVPAVAPRAPYDPVRDVTPISMIGVSTMFMFVNNDLPIRSLREFVEEAKRAPGRFSFASSGSGSLTQLMIDMLQVRAGIEVVSVPYRGAGPGMNDLAAGVVHGSFNSFPTAAPLVAARKVRPFAVASEARLPNLPDVPTFREHGIDIVVEHWMGIFGPANLPGAVVARLNAAIAQAVNRPELAPRLEELDIQPRPSTPEGFRTVLEEDAARWAEVIRSTSPAPTQPRR